MTEPITLNLTLKELQQIDKYIEKTDDTYSVLMKIKDAYPPQKSPAEEAFKRVYCRYPDKLDDKYGSAWDPFEKGYARAQKDYKVGEYQSSQKTPEPEENEWKLAALRFGEKLSDVGPGGYYDFTAGEWVEWALNSYDKKTPEPYCPDEIESDIDENKEKPKTLYNLIERWWCDVFGGINNDWDMETSIEDLCDRIGLWNMRNKK